MQDGNISSIQLDNGHTLTGDVYIDCSGYERVLIKNFNTQWVDISKDLPTDRTIPNPTFVNYNYIPPYTTAEASKNGWILDVPLSNRRGTGYVYSSKFTTDEEAKEDFNKWLLKTHNQELSSDRVIKFNNGYYKNTWVGNCLAMGLSSGFVEPLEATSIHHLIIQMDNFVRLFHGKHLEFDRKNYNRMMQDVYENAFTYIRFFYNTNRTDSDFWRYLTENKPSWLYDLEEKLKYSYLTSKDIPNDRYMFESTSFNCIAYGHGLYDKSDLKKFLDHHYLYDAAGKYSHLVRTVKEEMKSEVVDHKQWIDLIKSNP
jgi:tryptophan halogenase